MLKTVLLVLALLSAQAVLTEAHRWAAVVPSHAPPTQPKPTLEASPGDLCRRRLAGWALW